MASEPLVGSGRAWQRVSLGIAASLLAVGIDGQGFGKEGSVPFGRGVVVLEPFALSPGISSLVALDKNRASMVQKPQHMTLERDHRGCNVRVALCRATIFCFQTQHIVSMLSPSMDHSAMSP